MKSIMAVIFMDQSRATMKLVDLILLILRFKLMFFILIKEKMKGIWMWNMAGDFKF